MVAVMEAAPSAIAWTFSAVLLVNVSYISSLKLIRVFREAMADH